MTQDENIDIIMKQPIEDVVREILVEMDDFRVSWIRQRFQSRWQDGFWDRVFDEWYNGKGRKFFTFDHTFTKHYPAEGWSPEDDKEVGIWTCNLCGSTWHDDEIFVNHFRYGKCNVMNEHFKNSISEDVFLKKIKELNNVKN